MIQSDNIFKINSEQEFESLALESFRYQSEHNRIYNTFLNELGCLDESVNYLSDIPFLPISLFKTQKVVSGSFNHEIVFKSSGTSSLNRSSHYIKSKGLYSESFLKCFKLFYNHPSSFTIYALLPSYIENGDSSLVFMADNLIKQNTEGRGGFFLHDFDSLEYSLKESLKRGDRVILLGVTYALLDFASKSKIDLSEAIVIETGGMKGQGKEMLREEVHHILKSAFSLNSVHSEYGMTELLSQAWSNGDGMFRCPPWMKILVRDPSEPGRLVESGRTGGINIIDLANIHSCCFIETSDLGCVYEDGSFEIKGRFDSSDIRGCNLLV